MKKTSKMKRFLGKTTLVATLILLSFSVSAQQEQKPKNGKVLRYVGLSIIGTSLILMKDSKAPMVGAAIFGVGLAIPISRDLKRKRK